jgi:molybdopterin-guanine dinucleotide biosynthesis protein A
MGLGALILAGGGNKRFGGEKALFEVRGKPMIQHVVEEVSKLSGELVISCEPSGGRLARLFPQARVVPDKWDRRGALTGLMSALPEVQSEYVVLVTCDCPEIREEVIELLFESTRGHDGAIPRWPNGYIEPLQAVYRTEGLRRAAGKAWRDGKMRLADVIEMLPDVVYVPTEKLREADPTLSSFLNVNSPDEIANLR